MSAVTQNLTYCRDLVKAFKGEQESLKNKHRVVKNVLITTLAISIIFALASFLPGLGAIIGTISLQYFRITTIAITSSSVGLLFALPSIFENAQKRNLHNLTTASALGTFFPNTPEFNEIKKIASDPGNVILKALVRSL